MSILGPTYRFAVENRTGQTISTAGGVVLRIRPWKISSAGEIFFDSSFSTILNLSFVPLGGATSVGNLGYLYSNIIDNLANAYIGAEVELTVTAPASSNGNVILYLERSVDGGATWTDAGLGQILGDILFTTAGTKRLVIHL